MSNSSGNFYYDGLDAEAKSIYTQCLENLAAGRLQTTVSAAPTEENGRRTELVVDALLYGCPELFFLSPEVRTSWAGNSLTLQFSSKYAAAELSGMRAALEAELARISAIVNKFEDTYDRLNRINQYLCARVKPVNSYADRYGDAYGALILKEARCEGFAKAAKLIMDRCGIQGVIAKGTVLTGGAQEKHAWNIAMCGENYYQFDFSWNASQTQHGIPAQDYMFLDDCLAGREHTAEYVYPACTDNSKTFWALNRGEISFHSDLSGIAVVPFKKNYFAVAHLPRKLTGYESENEVFGWMENDLSAYSFGSQISYRYNAALDLLVFYFINE